MKAFLKKINEAALDSAWVFDLARSAEKMLDPNCCGDDNLAWKDGPYLSAPANEKEIIRTHPYCFKTSNEMSVLSAMILGDKPTRNKNGGIKAPFKSIPNGVSRAEPVIAKLAIIELFEIFKDFLLSFNGPYNKKKLTEWNNKIDDDDIDKITKLVDRRNELTHDDAGTALPTMKEAVDYYRMIRAYGIYLWMVATDCESEEVDRIMADVAEQRF